MIDDNATRPWADRAAMGLSGLCAVHCLLLPLAISLMPALAGLGLDDEAFHLWMVLVVLPISIYALFSGCRKHKNASVLALGFTGLGLLITALALGHDALGETGERAATLLGALLVAGAHIKNYRLCRSAAECDCTGA